jgi:hypothetical protein
LTALLPEIQAISRAKVEAHFRNPFLGWSAIAKIAMLRRPDPHDYPRPGFDVPEILQPVGKDIGLVKGIRLDTRVKTKTMKWRKGRPLNCLLSI